MLGEVLAQQVLTVVVAIGSAHNGVHVVLAGQVRPIEGDGFLMIVFDHHHRAVNTVVENTRRIGATNPGEVGIVPVANNLTEVYLGMPLTDVADIKSDQFQGAFTLRKC